MRKFLGALSSLYAIDAYAAVMKATLFRVLYPEIFQVAGNWHCTLLPTQSHNALFVCFSHVAPALFINSPFRAVPCFYRLFLFALLFFSFKTITTAITPAKPLNKRSSFTQGALEKMVLN